MGSLGHNDDESRRNKSNPNHIDSTDTEIQNDSQFPPSPVRGEKIKDGDAGEQQLTERMVSPDDAVSLEKDAFLAGETQVLDDPEECDGEVAVDSEGEGTDRTEVLSETDGFSDDDDKVREVDSHQVDEKTQYASLRKHDEKGLREEAELTVELRSSGSLAMPFMSVRAASLRASGLAAHSMASMGTNNGSSCSLDGNQSLRQSTVDGNGMSKVQISPRVREDVDQDHDLEKHIEEVDKFRVGCSTARKLFREDTLEDTISNAEVEANSPQLPAFENELAGLSYVDSQEPGDLSQANALDVVDRFIKSSVLEFDHEVDHGKINAKKSNPVSSAKRKQSLSKRSNISSTVGKAGTSAKGQQSLAKRADLRSTVGKAGIYEWDDSREDEGGGASLFKRKEEIFDGRGHSKRTFTQPRKPKGSIGDEFKKEQLNIGNKIMGLSHSDSKFVLRNSEENRKTVEAADLKIRKNLVTELNEASEQVDLNIGVDTQMAAEAMEALFNGEPLANHDTGDACRDGQNIPKGSCKGYSGGETKSKVPSKKPSSSKRSCPDSEIVTRQSQKRKRSDAKSNKESNTSLRKSTRNVRKEIHAELVKEKPNRAKSNAEKPLVCGGSENRDKTLLKTVEQRREGAVEVDGLNATAKSSGIISLETITCTPIAQRTRRCRVLHQLDRTEDALNDSREEMSCQVPKDKKKRSGKSVDAFELSSAKEKIPKVASTQSDDIENTTPGDLERPVPKLTAKTGDVGTDALSYLKGKRSRRNLSGQVNGSRNLDGPCKPSVGQEAIGQSITRKKRSKSNARRTLTDVDIKRTTRSSAGKLSQPKSGKADSGGAALNCDSADMSEKIIPKGQMELGPSKHSDMGCEAVPTSSIEGADQIAGLEVSPRESCKVSNSACTTPVNRVPRMNSASPVCMGNEYFKQSCKKNLSRSSLMKEINSLIATVPESTFAFKDSRRRRDMANVRVLFSHHLDEDTIKHQKKILARLGASIAASISDATHFITDAFVRTRNMLEAIACGKPVVTHLWLESCNQTSCFIDEKNYILRDAKKEKELGFSMPVSLVRACQHPLLQGRRVFITPNTKPGKEIIAALVKAVHGQAVERLGRSVLKDDKIPDDLLVISCEEDYMICMPFLEKGAAVYSSELLLNGIVIQKLEYERHRLFEDHVRETRSTLWMRKDGRRFQAVTKCK